MNRVAEEAERDPIYHAVICARGDRRRCHRDAARQISALPCREQRRRSADALKCIFD